LSRFTVAIVCRHRPLMGHVIRVSKNPCYAGTRVAVVVLVESVFLMLVALCTHP